MPTKQVFVLSPLTIRRAREHSSIATLDFTISSCRQTSYWFLGSAREISRFGPRAKAGRFNLFHAVESHALDEWRFF